MKYFIVILLICTASCSAPNSAKVSTKRTQPAALTSGFVLSNVHIVDVEKQIIHRDKTVSVENGVITDITGINDVSNELPRYPKTELTYIDGNGGYLTPGLIDMHVHIYEKASYALTLSHGVTHVRIMNGVAEQLIWREQVNAGDLIGSTSTVSSPIISAYEDAYLQHSVTTAAQAREAVRAYHRQGYDVIKAYGNLNQQALAAIVEEGQKLNMPIAKHGPHASGTMSVSALTGLQSFEHVEDIYQGPLNHQFDADQLPEIIAELKATEVAITPTLNIFQQLTKLSSDKQDHLSKTSQHYTSDIISLETKNNQVKRWLNASDDMAAHNRKTLNFLISITKKLHQSGVSLLVGSDSGVLLSPHGIATHNEMQLLQQAGLTSYEVLQAATINPAKALNMANEIGTIAPKYRADFIYSKSNPIEDLSVLQEPDAVVKSGNWYSQQQLQQIRNQAIESRSMWQEFWVLFDAL
ncbi:amidohydrolase family protein [Thalassotalea sp. Y01]|uniref:amidohydrolase family protein n=1 Tax=Thalassotalea sp. Y01 TaxID=2729613 RepID=UPI00145DBA35|nr:amidohydrolase family protein [Thalassotalea sp. Y01]NMP14795.1 amidohydrolase family protein [Thalassotalea sp. Y01]